MDRRGLSMGILAGLMVLTWISLAGTGSACCAAAVVSKPIPSRYSESAGARVAPAAKLQQLLEYSMAGSSHGLANGLNFRLPLSKDLSLDVLPSSDTSRIDWQHWESSQSLSFFFYKGESNALDLALSRTVETVQTLENSTISHYSLSGAYYPSGRWALMSELSLSSATDLWSGSESRTPAISFSVSYVAVEDILELTSFASYSLTRSNGADTTDSAISGSAGLIWTPVSSPLAGTTFFFDVTYSQYRDAISTDDEVSVLISWELLSF